MRSIWLAVFVLMSATLTHAEESGVLGQWVSPKGATIAIYRCEAAVCARVVGLSPQLPVHVDANNPDAALRTRTLCGLQIGSGFRLTDDNHAEDGQLYDPKSGKTYSGSMTSDGDSLQLRGYVGLRIFGRTEVWMRAKSDVPVCKE